MNRSGTMPEGVADDIGRRANIGGVAWLLWWTRRQRGPMATEPKETTGHVWDGDLRELNNPLPRWWLWLFVLTVLFGLIYLALYPGLGNFAGLKGWTQIEQYRRQTEQAEAVLARTFAPYEKQPVAALVSDPDAVRIGRNLFLNNCATCHGSDARGAPGFPNLADADWQWGGEAETIMESIANGRMGVMPGWGQVLRASEIENVLAYVRSLSGRTVLSGDIAQGKRKFGALCASCHQADGSGNPVLGAPNLTDSVWLHGGGIDAIRESIVNGRQGVMPAHLERLGEVRVKLLTAYVLSLDERRASLTRTAASAPEKPPDDGTGPEGH
jgi:cytochrome c oxidase cbb3-type subunit 3